MGNEHEIGENDPGIKIVHGWNIAKKGDHREGSRSYIWNANVYMEKIEGDKGWRNSRSHRTTFFAARSWE